MATIAAELAHWEKSMEGVWDHATVQNRTATVSEATQAAMQGPAANMALSAAPASNAAAGGTTQLQPAMPPRPKKPQRRVLTSLTLQIFVFFGIWWDVFYYILNILVFVYKGVPACCPAWACS